MQHDFQPPVIVPFFRRLWVVVLLTLLLFPAAMIVLFTGDVYRKKDGELRPIGNGIRYTYASLLALWLAAIACAVIASPKSISQHWAESADPNKPTQSAENQSGSQTGSTDGTLLDTCDSSDAADMVKGALESDGSTKLLDFGHAKETFFDKSRNVRRCEAEAVLNVGGAELVTYQLYFGPSGTKELVQVEQGVRAEQQQIMDRSDKADLAAATTPPAPQLQGQSNGTKYHRTNPASSDMTITHNGTIWHIEITGAGIPNGANTPSDCSLVAEGTWTNDEIHANVIPFKNDDMEVTEDDLKTDPGTVTVKMATTGAQVTQASVSPYCGVGSDLTGAYSRSP